MIILMYIVPTMEQLMDKVIPRVASEWKQVAFMLKFDLSRVNIIRQKGRDDPESCCCELLCDWLSTDHGIKPKNWMTLLTALKQIKRLTSVTDEIEKDLGTQLTMYVFIAILCNVITSYSINRSQNKSYDNINTPLTNTSTVLSQGKYLIVCLSSYILIL